MSNDLNTRVNECQKKVMSRVIGVIKSIVLKIKVNMMFIFIHSRHIVTQLINELRK